MSEGKKNRQLTVVIEEVLGASNLYKQGGSIRMTLPKKAQALLTNDYAGTSISNDTYIFAKTDKGFILFPLKKAMTDKVILDLDLNFDD